MTRQRDTGMPLSLRFIADREQHIAKQRELIAELKRKGCSTVQAEAELRRELLALAMLRNHRDLSLELTKADDPHKMGLSEGSGQRRTSARKRDG